MRLVAAGVIAANGEQARVFALRAAVWLQRHCVKARDFTQHVFEIFGEFSVTLGLLSRRERMHVAKLGPGHRHHLGGGIEFHRARAERDHGAVEREILVGQAAQIAQHFGFAVMGVEDGVGEDCRGATELRWQAPSPRGGGLGRGCVVLIQAWLRRQRPLP